MKAPLFALLFAASTACRSEGSERLEGRWKGVRADGVATDLQAAANTYASQLQIEARGDSITVSTVKGKQSGHYKVVREDKLSTVIVTDEDGPADEQLFTFDNERTMRWTIVDGKTITLTKE